MAQAFASGGPAKASLGLAGEPYAIALKEEEKPTANRPPAATLHRPRTTEYRHHDGKDRKTVDAHKTTPCIIAQGSRITGVLHEMKAEYPCPCFVLV